MDNLTYRVVGLTPWGDEVNLTKHTPYFTLSQGHYVGVIINQDTAEETGPHLYDVGPADQDLVLTAEGFQKA